jgi:hypothetical protein
MYRKRVKTMDSEWFSDEEEVAAEATIPVECSSKCCGGCSIDFNDKFEFGVLLELWKLDAWKEAKAIVDKAEADRDAGVITSDEYTGITCLQKKRVYREATYLNDLMYYHEIDAYRKDKESI